jgi:hypothetical protein
MSSWRAGREEAYGLFGMAAVATSLAYTILVDSAGLYVVRAPDLEPGHLDAVFWLRDFRRYSDRAGRPLFRQSWRPQRWDWCGRQSLPSMQL